jgi:hypothetical protein
LLDLNQPQDNIRNNIDESKYVAQCIKLDPIYNMMKKLYNSERSWTNQSIGVVVMCEPSKYYRLWY